VLNFIFDVRWYFAIPAGVAAFTLFPICNDFFARRGRQDNLERIVRRHRKPPS